jgi:hypothetical protein
MAEPGRPSGREIISHFDRTTAPTPIQLQAWHRLWARLLGDTKPSHTDVGGTGETHVTPEAGPKTAPASER